VIIAKSIIDDDPRYTLIQVSKTVFTSSAQGPSNADLMAFKSSSEFLDLQPTVKLFICLNNQNEKYCHQNLEFPELEFLQRLRAFKS
jgi:hypothetical protein